MLNLASLPTATVFVEEVREPRLDAADKAEHSGFPVPHLDTISNYESKFSFCV